MITIESVEKALKDVYLAVVSDQLDNRTSSVLSKISQTTNDVWGNNIMVSSCIYDEYYTFVKPLATIKMPILLSDKALRSCGNSSVALVNLLSDVIANAISDTSRKIRQAFFSEDSKPLLLPKDEQYEPLLLSGMRELFDENSHTLYGIDEEKHPQIVPKVEKLQSFDPIKIQEIIDNTNDEIDVIVVSSSIRRDYMQYLMDHKQLIEQIDMGNGFHGILFNGSIPLVSAPVDKDTIYLINTKDFKFHQLCDWSWLENAEGRILQQVIGKPIYSAQLIKYGNYICHNPHKQIKIVLNNGQNA